MDAAICAFNNVGAYDSLLLPRIIEAHFDRMFELKVKGLLFTTQAAAVAMNEQGGSVINVGSIASVVNALPMRLARRDRSTITTKKARHLSYSPSPHTRQPSTRCSDRNGFV